MLTTLGRIRSATLAKSGELAGAAVALAAIPDGAAAAGVDSVLGAAARADWQASARAPRAARAYGRMDIDEFSSERRKAAEAAVSIGCGARPRSVGSKSIRHASPVSDWREPRNVQL